MTCKDFLNHIKSGEGGQWITIKRILWIAYCGVKQVHYVITKCYDSCRCDVKLYPTHLM